MIASAAAAASATNSLFVSASSRFVSSSSTTTAVPRIAFSSSFVASRRSLGSIVSSSFGGFHESRYPQQQQQQRTTTVESAQRFITTTTSTSYFPPNTSSSLSLFGVNSSSSRRYFSSSSSSSLSAASSDDTMTPDALLELFQQTKSSSSDDDAVVGNAVSDAMYALYTADAVCFDVDSTVIAEEGIDVLADYLGKGTQVAELTKAAMDGGMKFQDALAARLNLLKPSKSSILQLLKDQPLQLTPGIANLMKSLQHNNIDIWLVSGGFRIMIEPVADVLNIPRTKIYANTLTFDESTSDGTYTGFDATEPTSADMGKPAALTKIQSSNGYKTMVMVGDGATDAQAKPPAAAFIGFGGVVSRPAVKDAADWFVTNFDDMKFIVEQRRK